MVMSMNVGECAQRETQTHTHSHRQPGERTEGFEEEEVERRRCQEKTKNKETCSTRSELKGMRGPGGGRTHQRINPSATRLKPPNIDNTRQNKANQEYLTFHHNFANVIGNHPQFNEPPNISSKPTNVHRQVANARTKTISSRAVV